eukprot:3937305-Rhodomonas_salina.1
MCIRDRCTKSSGALGSGGPCSGSNSAASRHASYARQLCDVLKSAVLLPDQRWSSSSITETWMCRKQVCSGPPSMLAVPDAVLDSW